MRIVLLLFLSSLSILNLKAQGIKGHVRDQTGEALPYATIYVRNIETGTTTNIDGYYEVKLSAGKYDVVYQYMGYESVTKVVDVAAGFQTINITLKPQTIVLRDVVIKAGKEDPAYTIIRKAIAKAKYHTNQLDEYKAQVYIKGSGRLIDSPFFLRKEIAKEGVDSTTAFTEESVIEIKYTRPNQYEERAIAIRTSGESNNTRPTSYINGSFYDPKIVDAVSPLSPKAFAYYRFVYKGTFKDRGYEVSTIRVIPRSKGDDLFAGDLNIIEDQWSIHSLDLKTTKFGIGFKVNQIYDPIEGKVWMPVSHKFDIEGTFLGFEFEYDYLATVSNYEIKLNPDLEVEIEVIDDKVEKELAKELEKENKELKNSEVAEMLQSGKEMTRKDLRKLLREYEKMELEEREEPKVVSSRKTSIDSTAYISDSTYWERIRPVPLTEYEKKGYHKIDSMAIEDAKQKEGDTTKVGRRKRGFHIEDIALGNTYKIGDKTHLKIKNMLPYAGLFNTVEGFNLQYGLELTKTFDNKQWVSFEPTARYSFAREKLVADGKLRWKWNDKTLWTFAGGRQVVQFNNQRPIHPIMNTLTTLLYERNYMKLYQKDFLSVKLNQSFSDKVHASVELSWADRQQLFNNTDYTLVDRSRRTYSPNAPVNAELTDTGFANHQALVSNVSLTYTPINKYRMENDEKIAIKRDVPEFNVRWTNGHDVSGSDVRYSLINIGVQQSFDIGIRGRLSYRVDGGAYLNKGRMTFADYSHFMGNKVIFQSTDPIKTYRLLDYYKWSTSDNYVSAFAYYDARKLLLTRLRFIQKRGLKEAVFVNYLGTDASKHYTEVGYGINNIFRLFRLEGVAAFHDGKYYDWGVRIGISTNLSNLISIE